MEWLTGLISGVALMIVARLVETHFKRDQYRHEKLVDRYADLASLMSEDLDHLRQIRSRAGRADELPPLRDKRNGLGPRFLVLEFQIRMLEPDAAMIVSVENLLASRGVPGLAFTNNHVTQISEDMNTIVTTFRTFLGTVAQRHGVWPFDSSYSG